jgi:endogenous inhibitor of DNA gyrase (YacG/DUF329 family)
MAACPICAKSAAPRPQNPAFPFCSLRCKAVDLGAWLSDEYRLRSPVAPQHDEVSGPPPSNLNEENE